MESVVIQLHSADAEWLKIRWFLLTSCIDYPAAKAPKVWSGITGWMKASWASAWLLTLKSMDLHRVTSSTWSLFGRGEKKLEDIV